MEIVLQNISDILHVTPLSKNFSVPLKFNSEGIFKYQHNQGTEADTSKNNLTWLNDLCHKVQLASETN
jgi:hypothetical protein